MVCVCPQCGKFVLNNASMRTDLSVESDSEYLAKDNFLPTSSRCFLPSYLPSFRPAFFHPSSLLIFICSTLVYFFLPFFLYPFIYSTLQSRPSIINRHFLHSTLPSTLSHSSLPSFSSSLLCTVVWTPPDIFGKITTTTQLKQLCF